MESKYVGYEWPRQDRNQILPSFLDSVAAAPRFRILDIGCGSGWLTFRLGEFANYVLGIDNDSHMIGRAQKENGRSNIEYELRDIKDIGKIRSSFDLAVSTLAIQMLASQKDLEKMLNEVPAEEIIMVVPHPSSIDKRESYSKYIFSEEFVYHNGGAYQVWLDNGKGGLSFSSRHMPLKSYINAIVNSDFQINELKEYGGQRLPYFLQLDLAKVAS